MRRLGLAAGVVVALLVLGLVFRGLQRPVEPPSQVTERASTPRKPGRAARAKPERVITQRAKRPPIDAAVEPVDAVDRALCADLESLGPEAVAGTLSSQALACMDARIRDNDDAENVLRLLTIYAWRVDRKLWAQRSVQLASISEDPDLHYKLALHFSKDEQPEVALHHIEVAHQESHVWPDDIKPARMTALDNLSGRLCPLVEDVPFCD